MIIIHPHPHHHRGLSAHTASKEGLFLVQRYMYIFCRVSGDDGVRGGDVGCLVLVICCCCSLVRLLCASLFLLGWCAYAYVAVMMWEHGPHGTLAVRGRCTRECSLILFDTNKNCFMNCERCPLCCGVRYFVEGFLVCGCVRHGRSDNAALCTNVPS